MSGSGGAGGYEYQAEATAYVAVHILSKHQLNWIEHSSSDIPIAVSSETGGAGDDINIELEDGTSIEVQAKKGLRKDDKFWQAIVKLAHGIAEDSELYGVLLVNSEASNTIKNDLSKDLKRLGEGRQDELKAITKELVEKLETQNVSCNSEIFRRLRVVIADFKDSLADAKTAQVLLSQVLDSSNSSEDAWKVLITDSLSSIANRGRFDIYRLSRLLKLSSIETTLGKKYTTWLDNELTKSKARCIARWQALGVSENTALSFLQDLSFGKLPPNLSFDTGRIRILVGEMGIGKSLIGDRIFQNTALKVLRNDRFSIPIYFEAQELTDKPLEQLINENIESFCDPQNKEIFVIIDEISEFGIHITDKILKEARILVRTWEKLTVLLLGKPIPELLNAQESVRLPLLSQEESEAIVRRIYGNLSFSAEHFTSEVKDTIRRPFFAILLGLELRSNSIEIARSEEQLLSRLIERRLHSLGNNIFEVRQFLEKLAAACVESGGKSILAGELFSFFDKEQLLKSKLVVEDSEGLRFPLPILTQWFAAQKLLSDNNFVETIAQDRQRLELWKYPCVIAVATFPSEKVSIILATLAQKQPAITAEIVNEAIKFRDRSLQVSSSPSIELGQKVRIAMESWLIGFKPFAKLTPFVQPDGTLPTWGVQFRQQTFGANLASMVKIAWQCDSKELPSIVQLNEGKGWQHSREFLPYAHRSWEWQWTLEQIIKSLLNSVSIPVESGDLSLEAAWFGALWLTGQERNLFFSYPIQLSTLENILIQVEDSLNRIPAVLQHCLKQLRIEVDVSREQGQTYLSLPPSFSAFRNGNSLDLETLRQYTEDVYKGALIGYQQLIDTLYPKFIPKLPLASILPVRLVGVIVPPQYDSDLIQWSYYWQPLSKSFDSEVSFTVESQLPKNDPKIQNAFQLIQAIYPEWRTHHFFRFGAETISRYWLGDNPVNRLAYKWLWEDLQRIGWLKWTNQHNNSRYWHSQSSHRSGFD